MINLTSLLTRLYFAFLVTSGGYKLPPLDSFAGPSTPSPSGTSAPRKGRPLSHAQTMPVLGFAAHSATGSAGHPFLAGPPAADPFLGGRNSGRELQPLFETRGEGNSFSRAASIATPIGDVANGPVAVPTAGAAGDGFDLDEVFGGGSSSLGGLAIPAFSGASSSCVFDPEAAGRSKSSIAHNGGTKRELAADDIPVAAEDVDTEPEDEVAPLPVTAAGLAKRTFGRSATVPSLPSGEALEMDVDF